jgi:hypothetical protein
MSDYADPDTVIEMLWDELELCARPGCGHDARRHNGLGCLYAVASEMPPAGFCSCPGYRTPAQQEAN